MAANDYHFTTHWRVHATIDEVFDVLSDVDALARWWPSVYLDVRQLDEGDPETGVGRVIDLYTKGWLPYTLRWKFRITEVNRPYGFKLTAEGDFNGRGEWTLVQDGEWADVTYDWEIAAEKPLLRSLSFLLKPLFSWNHHWAMARGEESLHLELARRQAGTPEMAALVPAPPPPTTLMDSLAPAALVLALLAGVWWMLRHRPL